ncbi:hypothetical protein MIMGU_mgv1a025598mg [Erythranthe guttata]|uniref:Uncharacterized protein n=2 Tax=Erythranthe guttata TaxID=4155 RepID=A0A022S0P2_ERYGU|nr:hypothetical protein MIMGU_mgv1a025598mg [Erythranthe guttata]
MDNMDGAELYGRVLTVNYALPEKIKGGEVGWAAQPIWADADTWFERQQLEQEIQRLQSEQKAAMLEAEELHRKKLAEERDGEKDEEADSAKGDPMAIKKDIKRAQLKKNPLKNINVMPYAKAAKRMALLAEAQRVKAKQEKPGEARQEEEADH